MDRFIYLDCLRHTDSRHKAAVDDVSEKEKLSQSVPGNIICRKCALKISRVACKF